MKKNLITIICFTVAFLIITYPLSCIAGFPTGFAGINIGDKWSSIKDKHKYSINKCWPSDCNEDCGQFLATIYIDDAKISIFISDYTVCYVIYQYRSARFLHGKLRTVDTCSFANGSIF